MYTRMLFYSCTREKWYRMRIESQTSNEQTNKRKKQSTTCSKKKKKKKKEKDKHLTFLVFLRRFRVLTTGLFINVESSSFASFSFFFGFTILNSVQTILFFFIVYISLLFCYYEYYLFFLLFWLPK